MSNFEQKLSSILIDLKQNFYVNGLKLEFEAEGATYKEAVILRELSKKIGLNLIIKIAGCEAIRDLYDTKALNADIIVAPMIESKFALKKFCNAILEVFCDDNINKKKFFINIESITGFKNIDEILSSEEFDLISGIIFGRTDFVNSIGIKKEDVNCDTIFEKASSISEKMKLLKKDFIVGGGVFVNSIPFFQKLPFLTAFETRKIIFNSQSLFLPDLKQGIIKAIEFEIEWLNYKAFLNNFVSEKDKNRIEQLKQYFIKI